MGQGKWINIDEFTNRLGRVPGYTLAHGKLHAKKSRRQA